MPCPGKIEGLRLPEGLGLRNDCGVYEGAEVPIYYDPMIAKLICWGENRVEAILRMRRALREYQVRGIKTNISFHQWILRHPRFMSGDFNTGFIDEEYRASNSEEVLPHKEIALASAAIAALHGEQERTLRLLAKGAGRTVQMARTGQAQRAAPRVAWQPTAGGGRRIGLTRHGLYRQAWASRATPSRSKRPASRSTACRWTATNSSSTAKRPAGPITP